MGRKAANPANSTVLGAPHRKASVEERLKRAELERDAYRDALIVLLERDKIATDTAYSLVEPYLDGMEKR